MTADCKYLIVDGHSVLFHWTELRQLQARQPRKAREELRKRMELLHDSSHWRVTLVFDGAGSKPDATREAKSMALIYSQKGQTADAIIEQIVAGHPKPEEILVITADEAEKQTVEALGASCFSPDWLEAELTIQGETFHHRMEAIHRSERWTSRSLKD